MPPTSGAGSAASPPQPGSALPNGRRASCGTASSLLSDKGVLLEQIARLVGHTSGSTVTETVYRKQLRPVINDGAAAMNELAPSTGTLPAVPRFLQAAGESKAYGTFRGGPRTSPVTKPRARSSP